jgi:hypothetical protein
MYASILRRFPSASLTNADDAAGSDVLVPLTLTSPETRSLPGRGLITARLLSGRRLRVDASADLPAGIASALSIVWARWAAGAVPRGPQTDAQFGLEALRWLESHGGEVLEAIAALQAEAASDVGSARAASSSAANHSSASPPPVAAAAVSSASGSAGGAGGCGSGSASAGGPLISPSKAAVARPPSRPPSPPRTPLDAALVHQAEWTRDEHAAFERALRRLFAPPAGRRLDDARAWAEISAAVGTPRATPAACAARFLALSHVARAWLQRSRDTAPPATPTPSLPLSPESAATQARVAPPTERAGRAIAEDTLRFLEAADVPVYSRSSRVGGGASSGAGGGYSGEEDAAAAARVDDEKKKGKCRGRSGRGGGGR